VDINNENEKFIKLSGNYSLNHSKISGVRFNDDSPRT
jgi:hypothetical protein